MIWVNSIFLVGRGMGGSLIPPQAKGLNDPGLFRPFGVEGMRNLEVYLHPKIEWKRGGNP
jgi:hypothetical protein